MKNTIQERPSVAELETELRRVKYKQRYNKVLRSTVFTLITVAAMALLVATLWLPVLQIYGSSMTPTLQDGDIIFSVKTDTMEQGDIIAFLDSGGVVVIEYYYDAWNRQYEVGGENESQYKVTQFSFVQAWKAS